MDVVGVNAGKDPLHLRRGIMNAVVHPKTAGIDAAPRRKKLHTNKPS